MEGRFTGSTGVLELAGVSGFVSSITPLLQHPIISGNQCSSGKRIHFGGLSSTMTDSKTAAFPKSVQWAFELMAIIYVAAAVTFLVNPDLPILVINKAFVGYEWPMVFFPTERFWLSIAAGVPATRAYVAFCAARNPARAHFSIQVLQVSLLVPAALFAWQFVFSQHAPLYVIGAIVETVQVAFYAFLSRKLP
jgi:hypothetical protein